MTDHQLLMIVVEQLSKLLLDLGAVSYILLNIATIALVPLAKMRKCLLNGSSNFEKTIYVVLLLPSWFIKYLASMIAIVCTFLVGSPIRRK